MSRIKEANYFAGPGGPGAGAGAPPYHARALIRVAATVQILPPPVVDHEASPGKPVAPPRV